MKQSEYKEPKTGNKTPVVMPRKQSVGKCGYRPNVLSFLFKEGIQEYAVKRSQDFQLSTLHSVTFDGINQRGYPGIKEGIQEYAVKRSQDFQLSTLHSVTFDGINHKKHIQHRHK